MIAHSQVEGGVAWVDYILGLQLLNKGDPERGLPILEKVHKVDPSHPDYAAALARVQFELGRYADVSTTLAAFKDEAKASYKLTVLLGRAHQAAGEYDQAIRYLNAAVTDFGINANLLNLLGECFIQLGERESALVALEKSLELDPNQDRIKQLVQSLKKSRLIRKNDTRWRPDEKYPFSGNDPADRVRQLGGRRRDTANPPDSGKGRGGQRHHPKASGYTSAEGPA